MRPSSASFCASGRTSVIAERMKPGAMQLTVMPRLADLLRQRLGHADQPGLGGGIIGLAGIAGRADHRGDRDDPAEAGAHHRLQRRAGEAEGGLEVDPDHVGPFLVLHPHREIVAGDAGIVDQDVELPERLDRLRHQRVDRGAVAKVADQGDMIAAEPGAKGLELARRSTPKPRAAPPAPPAPSAIAEPIPPEAPVTRAVIPVRSNMSRFSLSRHSSASWNLIFPFEEQ